LKNMFMNWTMSRKIAREVADELPQKIQTNLVL
jgi:hypothetical protein